MLARIRGQDRVVEAVVGGVLRWLKDKEVYFFFGPPGTGKTTVASQLCFSGRVEYGGKTYDIGKRDCAAVYFNVSMKDDLIARNVFTFARRGAKLVRTLDGFVVSALHGLYSLYTTKSANGEWLDPASSIEALRAKVANMYGLRYTTDPFESQDNLGRYEGNEAFRFFDLLINATPPANILSMFEALNYFSFELARIHSKARAMLETYVKFLLGKKKLDFTLARWVEAVQVRRKYVATVKKGKKVVDVVIPDAVLIDEAQDLSPLMWWDVMALFPDVKVVVIAGDDDQTVYDSLHGANPRIMLRIAEALQKGELNGPPPIVLKQSHRVPKEVAEYAKSIIEKMSNRWPKEWAGRDVVANVYHVSLKKALEDIAQRYEVAMRAQSSSRIFVLAPTNYEVYLMYANLMARGVMPSSLKAPLPPKFVHAIVWTLKNKQPPPGSDVASRGVAALIRYLESQGREPYIVLQNLYNVARQGNSPVIVDTAYTAKGLEADVVYLCNFTKSHKAVGRRRPFYVAATRTKTNLYIIEPPPNFYRWL